MELKESYILPKRNKVKKLYQYIDLKRLSIFLIFVPYLIFNFPRIFNSPFYENYKFLNSILILVVLDILFKKISMKLNAKISWVLSISVLFLLVLFLYGNYFVLTIQNFISAFFNHFIRGRQIVVTYIALSSMFFFSKPNSFKFLNAFLLILTSVLFINSFSSNTVNERTFKNNFLKLTKSKNDSIKPTILIITDEYSSPDEIFKYQKDSSVYNFSNNLILHNWNVKNSSYSYETSTIHSLSSMFNFNLSNDTTYMYEQIDVLGPRRLIKSTLYDSLIKKNIFIKNLGIFDFGKSQFYKRMYFYPLNFFEDLFCCTTYYTIKNNTNSFETNGFKGNYYPFEPYNKSILMELNNIKKNDTLKNKTFIYSHLLMPHGPYQFLPEFSFKKLNTKNYIAYWRFTNSKLEIILNNLIQENKYRIILTGDHGFRGDNRINPHNTFTAFYGFDEELVDNIKSVQDLGSLIIAYF
jgi:hypothetical protein